MREKYNAHFSIHIYIFVRGHKWEGGETINLRQFLLPPAPTFVVFSLFLCFSVLRNYTAAAISHFLSDCFIQRASTPAAAPFNFRKMHQTQSDDLSFIVNEIWRENKTAKHLKFISLALSELGTILHHSWKKVFLPPGTGFLRLNFPNFEAQLS